MGRERDGIMQSIIADSAKLYFELTSEVLNDEGLTLETSAFRFSLRWSIYHINPVDKPISVESVFTHVIQ